MNGTSEGNPPVAFKLLKTGSKRFPFTPPGRDLWSVQLKDIESQAVLLPDLQGDSVPDLLIATLPTNVVKLRQLPPFFLLIYIH